MGKQRQAKAAGRGTKAGQGSATPSTAPPAPAASAASAQPLTTSAIAHDDVLGYKLRVLLYDLRNLTRDQASERRLNSTTDERYLGPPYFTPGQAAAVKTATVDVAIDPNLYPDIQEYLTADTEAGKKVQDKAFHRVLNESFEKALDILLDRFLDKRRASGDARPCGPHHLAPLYASLFGVKMDELQETKLLSRIRRQGLAGCCGD